MGKIDAIDLCEYRTYIRLLNAKQKVQIAKLKFLIILHFDIFFFHLQLSHPS